MWIKLLKVLGYLWLGVAGLLILIGYYAIYQYQGFERLQEVLSPHNIWNVIANLIVLAPGIGLLTWAKKLEKADDKII